jgi:hypothetical protein
LVKTIWLNDQLFRTFQRMTSGSEQENSLLEFAQVRTLVEGHLIESGALEKFLADRGQYFRGSKPNDPRNYFFLLPFVRAAIDHYDAQFKEKHLGNPKTSLVELFDSLDRETQMQLLRQDAAEAQKSLERVLIQRKYAENPALAGLADELRRIHTRPSFRSGFNRSGGGSGSGSGSGRERGEFGGPPREDRRNGRDGNRDDGRRPPDPGGFRGPPPERPPNAPDGGRPPEDSRPGERNGEPR